MTIEHRSKLKIVSLFLKIFLGIIPLLLIAWLFEQNFCFTGKKILTYDFKKTNPFISHLEPWERLSSISEDGKNYFQEMRGDMVYFTVKKNGDFDKISVIVEYQNPKAQLFDLGLRINKKEAYLKLPLEAKILDSLPWERTTDNDGVLYQKEKKYPSLKEFLEKFPKDKKVVVYNFDLKKYFPKEKNFSNVSPLRVNTNLDETDFILANYHSPEKVGDSLEAKNTFNFRDAYVDEKGEIKFLLSAPALNETGTAIQINKIKVVFERPPLSGDKIIRKIRNFFKI